MRLLCYWSTCTSSSRELDTTPRPDPPPDRLLTVMEIVALLFMFILQLINLLLNMSTTDQGGKHPVVYGVAVYCTHADHGLSQYPTEGIRTLLTGTRRGPTPQIHDLSGTNDQLRHPKIGRKIGGVAPLIKSKDSNVNISITAMLVHRQWIDIVMHR